MTGSGAAAGALAALDDAFRGLHRDERVPGVAWGVVAGGELVHTGGIGTARDGSSWTPDADTVFRIASMTKSFTAATVLLLRDEGRLRLDDAVGDHVPALPGWRGPTADSRPVTIRELLTMSAGLPTDDPWGDRQQGLAIDAFEALLRAGPTFAWPPGTTFEYSNLGYGILGRVITSVAGREYREVVRDRLLVPLGMTSTGFDEDEIPVDRLAHGYLRVDDALVREGDDGYGAMASMGGLYSTVRDVARWVAGFLDAFPARDDPEGGHPLPRAVRREMQQAYRVWPAEEEAHAAHVPQEIAAGGYGYGLFASTIVGVGTVAGHGGGYPGYGTQMVWHPGSGLGVVAMGNSRYAGVHAVAQAQLIALVRAGLARSRPVRARPVVDAAVAGVDSLLSTWDDGLADRLFAMNMDLDEARPRRRDAIERSVAAVGRPLRVDPGRPDLSTSPLHRRRWLRGEHGWLDVGMRLSPEPTPRIQALRVTAVLDPSAALVAARDRLLRAAGDGVDGRWPADLAAAPGVDREIVMRGLAVVRARSGSLVAGPVSISDGTGAASWPLGDDACIRVAIDATSGEVTAAAVTFVAQYAPAEDW